MDTYQAIITKRDIREFGAKPVPEETLRRILQAGRMAGSARNHQPCRMVVLRERDNIDAIAACGDFTDPLRASVLVIVVLTRPDAITPEFDRGRTAQNLMLAAWSEGVTSCPTLLPRADEARIILGAPDQYEASIAIGFGYPATDAKSAGRQRKPVDEYVHYEQW